MSDTDFVGEQAGKSLPPALGPFALSGCIFTIVSTNVELLKEIDGALVDLRATAAEIATGETPIEFRLLHTDLDWLPFPWSIWRGEELCARASDVTVVRLLIERMGHLATEQVDSRHLVLKGTAITRAGQAILLVGVGATSLATRLLTCGWGMTANDLVILDVPDPSDRSERPSVKRCWFPIRINASGPLSGLLDDDNGRWDTLVPASQLGALATSASLAAVVWLDPTSEHIDGITTQSPATSLGVIATHTPALSAEGQTAFDLLADLVSAVPGAELMFDDLDKADVALTSIVQGARLPDGLNRDNPPVRQ